ncbi:hypothetical protein [Streptomyces sporangiiformans]|uniref:Uncharacterized protein n=1 Tax=Streptomyces sporangiiformans TaxID=2315329 RepID=A0A505DGF1_9ACTN|nr:hypothetical protein [Streptomyces sporangiiformans]TPQ22157.1 hypothetical protein FGD71_011130 [Streptomyces sporangiiformans]
MADLPTNERLYIWGRNLFQQQQEPVLWAGSVLGAAARKMGRSPEIDEALILAEREDQWPRGREVFDRIRRRSLSREDPLTEEHALYFALAELVAKLAHNAAGQRPPFDHDSGWRVGPTAYRLAGATDDPELHEDLTRALGGWLQDL